MTDASLLINVISSVLIASELHSIKQPISRMVRVLLENTSLIVYLRVFSIRPEDLIFPRIIFNSHLHYCVEGHLPSWPPGNNLLRLHLDLALRRTSFEFTLS
jgi:hypothetical protein